MHFRFRTVVVESDTTFEDLLDHYRPDKGLKLILTDNIFRVWTFNEYRNKKRNGISMSFYPMSNMPQAKGRYINDLKDGEWFYWNEKGILLKTEKWQVGNLILTKKMTSGK